MPVIAQPSSGFGVGLMAICWRMGFPFYKDYCIPQKALTSALPFLSTEKRWDVLHLLWLGMADGDLLLKNALPSNWSRLKCSICLFCSDADWKWNLFSKYSYLKLGYHHRRNVQFRARSHQAPLEELSSRGWRSTIFTALPICAFHYLPSIAYSYLNSLVPICIVDSPPTWGRLYQQGKVTRAVVLSRRYCQ